MSAILLTRTKPQAVAARHPQVEAEVPLAALERLAAMGSGEAGDAPVAVSVTLTVEDSGIVALAGSARTEMVLACQRCLEPVTLPVRARFRLLLVGTEDLEHVPDRYAAVAVPAEGLRLAEVIEDELLLAVPLAPRHADVADCGPLAHQLAALDGAGDDGEKTTSPFSGLRDLLDDR